MNGFFCENMKFIILSTIALVSATQVNSPPRSVNVALETSFLFDPKDVNENTSLVNNIRDFLDKLYTMLGSQKAKNQFRTEPKLKNEDEPGLQLFVEVMKNIGQNFLNMSGEKIKEAINVVEVEVKNITEQKKQEIFPQLFATRTQHFIKDLLSGWMQNKPADIKAYINTTVYENKPLLNTFARRMNNYYNPGDVKKLNKILKKFRRYIASNKNTTKIVKKLLHNTVFKKYDKLNESARAAVITDLKMLSEFLVPKKRITESRRTLISDEVADKSEFPDDITYSALRKSIDEKIRDTRKKNEDKKKGKNDVVVGKLELILESPRN